MAMRSFSLIGRPTRLLALWLTAMHLCCACKASHAATAPTPSLVPWPQQVRWDEGTLFFPIDLSVAIEGPKVSPSQADGKKTSARNEQRVRDAIARMQHQWRMANASAHAAPSAGVSAAPRLLVQYSEPGTLWPQPIGDESYTLAVQPDGITLRATTPTGVLRGLATLTQWLSPQNEILLARPGHVHDRPRFVWRGLLLDVARHFVPVPEIKKQLEAMALYKLNVLHWHLSDDQSFRLQISRYERLHQMGAQGGLFYTPTQVREVVAFAAERGIRVIPEIDMPGHVESWLLGYPQLASGEPPHELSGRWGIFDAALDPSNEETYAFVDGLLGEVAGLFVDPYIHLGGDEVTGKQWLASPNIRRLMARLQVQTPAQLQHVFFRRVAAMAERYGKHAIGWDEVLHDALPPQALVQSWRGEQGLADALSSGQQAIVSHGFYLMTSLQAHYLNDPAKGLAQDVPDGLLGGEACQWTELVNASLLDASLWPRTMAVAERLWSARQVRDVEAFRARLAGQQALLFALGIDVLRHQQALIASLVAPSEQSALRKLAQLTESERQNWYPGFTQRHPLDRFADALLPESEAVHAFSATVDTLLDDNIASAERDRAFASAQRFLLDAEQTVAQVHAVVLAHPTLCDVAAINARTARLVQAGLWALVAARREQGAHAPAANEPNEPEWLTPSQRSLGVRYPLAVPVQRLLAASGAPSQAFFTQGP